MDILKYRNLIVSDNNWTPKVLELDVYDIEFYSPYRDCRDIEIHPLVESGQAYWRNGFTLVLGYILNKNKNIFLPIWSFKREDIVKSLHLEVKEKTKDIIMKIRINLVYNELIKLKILPENIIKLICKLI